MTRIICSKEECIYCEELECKRTSIALGTMDQEGYNAVCMSMQTKSPAGATTPSKALENITR